MSLGQLLRTANDHGYTTVEWEQWKKFLEARNDSAHAYNEAVANVILAEASEMMAAATEILEAIRRKEAT